MTSYYEKYKTKKILNKCMLRILQKRRRPTLPRDAVPSAQTGLTSLFGMVRGEPRRYNHLKLYPAPDAGSLSLKERLIS